MARMGKAGKVTRQKKRIITKTKRRTTMAEPMETASEKIAREGREAEQRRQAQAAAVTTETPDEKTAREAREAEQRRQAQAARVPTPAPVPDLGHMGPEGRAVLGQGAAPVGQEPPYGTQADPSRPPHPNAPPLMQEPITPVMPVSSGCAVGQDGVFHAQNVEQAAKLTALNPDGTVDLAVVGHGGSRDLMRSIHVGKELGMFSVGHGGKT
jgi:hypothetical protein